MHRAWELNDSGRYDASIEICHAALRLDDRCVEALLCRSNSYIKQKRLPLAHADLTRLLEIEPENHTAYTGRAWAFNEAEDYGHGREAADQAIRLWKHSAEAYFQRAYACYGLGLHQDAVNDATKAIELRPKYAWAYHARSLAHAALGHKDLAEKDLAQARELGLMGDTDSFQAGTSWLGDYKFTKQFTSAGTVSLRITRRSGEEFEGEYLTRQDGQEFKWRVKGTLKQGKLDFGFIEWLAGGSDSKGLVGNGRVTGDVRGEKLILLFVDPRDGSEAKMELKREK